MDLRICPPRSPRCRLGGIVHLPRLLDKARAAAAGTLGDYQWNCPLDQRLLRFLGIDPDALLEAVRSGKSDTEMLAWVGTCAPNPLDESSIAAFSAWMEQLGPGDPARHRGFAKAVVDLQPGDDGSLLTTFERLDWDDYQSFRAPKHS